MKKFYYKKEGSQDKNPFVLRLERRHTMSINKDEMQEEQSRMSARTASASSIDRFAEAPTIPRLKSREVAKSLSEDVLSKSRPKTPKIVTETDLSSSWLYKTMQASVNARFKSPRKSPSVQQGDLEPVALQDPNLKPMPVNSSAEKTSSCLCHFATMIAISLCTIGFLASIAGIIYAEVFAGRNLTSLPTSETKVDLSDVVLGSREELNHLSANEFNIDEDMVTETSSEATDTLGVTILNKQEADRGVLGRLLDNEKENVAGLNQLINTTETKIKFQDGETVIYEVKSSDSLKYEMNSNILEPSIDDHFEDRLNETAKNEFSEDVIEELSEKLETFLDSQFGKLDVEVNESESVSIANPPNSNFSSNWLKDDLKDSKSNSELEFEYLTEMHSKLNGSENSDLEFQTLEETSHFPLNIIEYDKLSLRSLEPELGPNPETNDLFHSDKEIKSSQPLNNNSGDQPGNLHELTNVGYLPESQSELPEGTTLSSISYVDDHTVKSDHDVDVMVMTVDDPEEAPPDYIFDRSGEVAIETSSFKPSERPNFVQSLNEHPDLPKRPVDIKVSLAEAMKHLQVLDVNNKLLTSRIKSPKPQFIAQKEEKQSNISKKGDISLEKMQYLQKVRLMLYEHLQ